MGPRSRSSHPLQRCAIAVAAIAIALPFTSSAAPTPLDAVRAELTTDGALYTVIDLEEGWSRVGREMDEALAAAGQDMVRVGQLLESLGLTQVRAIGMSSRAVPGGYDNRLFLAMPEGRTGLFSIFPGEPRPFTALKLAPADADLFVELRIDLGALTSTLTTAAEHALADETILGMIREGLGSVEEPLHSAMTYSGTVAFTARLRESADGAAPTLSGLDFFARVDGVGSLLLPWLEKSELGERVEHPTLLVFKSTDGVLVALDGETALIASDLAFLDECRTRKQGLDQAPLVRELLGRTADAGHSLVYTSPRLLEKLQGVAGLAQDLALRAGSALPTSDRLAIAQAFAMLPKTGAPHVSVIVARPDGLLMREISATSNKTALPVVAAFTPDFLGLIAVQATRGMSAALAASNARETARASLAPDLEAIAAAARSYFTTHPDEDSVSLTTLREQPGGVSLPDLAAALEDELVVARTSDEIIAWHREHGQIRHVIPLSPEQRSAIEANLRQVEAAAALYLVLNDTGTVYGSSLFDGETAERPATVVGEDYDLVMIEDGATQVSVTTPGGQEVTIPVDPAQVTHARRQVAEQRYAIEQNLARIDVAAMAWFKANPDSYSVSLEALLSDGGFTAPEPVAGESYADLEVYRSSTELYVEAPRIGTIRFVRPLDPALETQVRERLTELADLASAWFRDHPQAALVLAAELLPAERLAIVHPDADEILGATPVSIEPALNRLVIRRTDTAIAVEVEGRGSVTVPRR